jgi:peroxiredoxin
MVVFQHVVDLEKESGSMSTFTLPGTDGKTHTLSASRGTEVIVAWSKQVSAQRAAEDVLAKLNELGVKKVR